MKDLLEYLSDNKISHKEIDETFLFINEEKYKLLIPDDGNNDGWMISIWWGWEKKE